MSGVRACEQSSQGTERGGEQDQQWALRDEGCAVDGSRRTGAVSGVRACEQARGPTGTGRGDDGAGSGTGE